MTYKYHDLEWSKLFQRSCTSRFARREYRGRCELRRNHRGDHAAERGMEWVRWSDDGWLWYTIPGSELQDRSPGLIFTNETKHGPTVQLMQETRRREIELLSGRIPSFNRKKSDG